MKRAMLPLLVLMAAQCGCVPGIGTGVGEEAERISYHDRNADGKVDREFHRFVGWADADWELLDNDFNGRFETEIRYGVGVFESAVDISVPKGVHVEPATNGKKT